MPKRKTENTTAVQIMLIVALVVIAVFVMALKSTTPQVPMTPPPTDFNGTSTELNGVDIDKIDSGLDQLNTQTTSF